MTRYKCLMLGHSEQLIQEALDSIPPEGRILGIVSVGVNVMALVELEIKNPFKQNDTRRNNRQG